MHWICAKPTTLGLDLVRCSCYLSWTGRLWAGSLSRRQPGRSSASSRTRRFLLPIPNSIPCGQRGQSPCISSAKQRRPQRGQNLGRRIGFHCFPRWAGGITGILKTVGPLEPHLRRSCGSLGLRNGRQVCQPGRGKWDLEVSYTPQCEIGEQNLPSDRKRFLQTACASRCLACGRGVELRARNSLIKQSNRLEEGL
jgi:hypothetical protein